MRTYFSGIWVYFLTIGCLVLIEIFFLYVKANPSSNFEKITKLKSQNAIAAKSPCFNALSGEPSIMKGDNYLKINITCPDGTYSTNILRYSALPSSHNLLDTLNMLTQINNLNIVYDSDNQILAMGNIKNTDQMKWKVNINSAPIITNYQMVNLIPNNVVEIKYEKK